MATTDGTDLPTATHAGPPGVLAQSAPLGLLGPPPGQVRPVHDDLPAERAVVREQPALDPSVVEELVGAPTRAPEFERPAVAGAGVPTGTADEADPGRGTPLQALAGWGAALVVGAACWAGALAVVGRVV